MARWMTNHKTGNRFPKGTDSLSHYLATKDYIRNSIKNVKGGVPNAFIKVNGLPHQSKADLKWENDHRGKPFWVDVHSLFTIQPYVEDRHVKDLIKEGIEQYRIPVVRKYGDHYFLQDGTHRAEALVRLGYQKLPVVIAGNDPSPKDGKKYLIGAYMDMGS